MSNYDSKQTSTHLENDQNISQIDGDKTTIKRKERSDKNKRRKHPNRAYNASSDLLKHHTLSEITKKLKLGSKPNLNELNNLETENIVPFDPKMDYFREFYRQNLENENLMTDLDLTSNENYKLERQLLNIIDFYDCTLLPSVATQPHKFIHRK